MDNFAGHRFNVGTLPWSHHVLGEKAIFCCWAGFSLLCCELWVVRGFFAFCAGLLLSSSVRYCGLYRLTLLRVPLPPTPTTGDMRSTCSTPLVEQALLINLKRGRAEETHLNLFQISFASSASQVFTSQLKTSTSLTASPMSKTVSPLHNQRYQLHQTWCIIFAHCLNFRHARTFCV